MPDVFHQVYSPVAGSVLLSALVASLPPLLLALLLAVLRVAPWRAAIAAAATAFVLAWLVWGMPLTLTIAATTHGMAVTTLGGLLAPMLGHDAQSTTRALSAMVGRQLPFFSLAIPAYLVILYAGWRRMVEVWPAVLVAGGVFAIGQFTVSNFVGPELTDALSALVSLTAVALLLRVWQPAEEFTEGGRLAVAHTGVPDTAGRVVRAYATYGVLIVTVLIGQIGNFAGMSTLKPPTNVTALLKCGQIGNGLCPEPWVGQTAAVDPQGFRFPVWEFNWPGAYQMQDGKPIAIVQREVPVVAASTPYPLTYRLDFLAAAGTLVFVPAFLAFIPMMIRGLAPGVFFATLVKTLRQLRLPIVTIAFILSIATVMNYSGMTSSMALALAKTGVLFPFFAAWLGMIGVFLTRSDTSSNTLFGPLQATTARLSGLDPILMGATNSSAGAFGHIVRS